MPKRNSGFTLIELMIVIAILSILMAIAVPAYQDYTIRTKVSEGLHIAASAKMAVTETFHSDGTIPDQAATGWVFSGTDYVDSITIDGTGTIRIVTQATGATDDPVLDLRPTLVSGEPAIWNCERVSGLNKHLPADCRN
ncbi:MAG: pilin [Xanthomonadales bacterium]|nr:pilin [Xanthomonadales bacterium]|tara:strand:+ start:632 stop:1048 length:417 start_codon:yes stop_codon:yes gene_type:complete